jgi:cholesterol transport system auxiliary component
VTLAAASRAAAACASLAAVAVLAACTGSLFQSKAVPSSVYLLSANLEAATTSAASSGAGTDVTAQPVPSVPVDLAVLRPRIRRGLETDRIAVLYPDRRLDYFADARWSGPLDEVVQDLAVQALRSGAHLRNVSADASAFASGYWIEIEVADFQAEYSPGASAPTIHVRLLARLGGAGDRHILGSFDAHALQPAGDDRLTAIVDAYEKAVDAALADIVASTSRTLGAAQSTRKPVASASR